MTDARVGRVAEKVLAKPHPDARVGKVGLKVLVRLSVAPVGPEIRWWDGAAMQTATLKGWWDGTTIQPVASASWWDGTALQPLA